VTSVGYVEYFSYHYHICCLCWIFQRYHYHICLLCWVFQRIDQVVTSMLAIHVVSVHGHAEYFSYYYHICCLCWVFLISLSHLLVMLSISATTITSVRYVEYFSYHYHICLLCWVFRRIDQLVTSMLAIRVVIGENVPLVAEKQAEIKTRYSSIIVMHFWYWSVSSTLVFLSLLLIGLGHNLFGCL